MPSPAGYFRLMILLLATIILLAGAAHAGAAESGIDTSAGAAPAIPETTAELSVSPAKAAVAPHATRQLDGIMAIQDERGRIVYVNAPPPAPAKVAASMPRRSSNLVYWSSKEKRWIPVPPPSPSAMRAALNAADEVMDYVQERTAAPGSAKKQPEAAQPAAPHASTAGQRKSYNHAVLAELRQERSEETPALRPAAGLPRLAAGNQRPATVEQVVSTKEIDEAIERAAARHKVDPNLVRAMIKVESNFNPHAVSKKGAMGLMQLMPATARSLDVSHPFDPNENVDAGVRHLRTLLDNYGGNVKLSLAAYNAGETAVARHNGVPAIPETTNYVKQITRLYSNGGPQSMFLKFGSRPGAAPVRVYRNPNGVLTMSNE
jgi:soluble lytic murein transglycosylase-like protein